MAAQERARNVADIRCDKDAEGNRLRTLDANGDEIVEIYGRKPPEYAVYRACGRVMVHFADADAVAAKQRRRLAALSPLRDEIEGLIGGWRSSTGHGFFGLKNSHRLNAKAECQDRRVGGALVQALEGRLGCGELVLEKIKADVLNERIAWARFEYLLTAFASFLALMFVGWLLTLLLPDRDGMAGVEMRMRAAAVILLLLFGLGAIGIATGKKDNPVLRAGLLFLAVAIPIAVVLIWPGMSMAPVHESYQVAVDVARGALAGALGAFFSISLAIRGRTILPDLQRTGNMMDALLRVTIGFIAGAVLTMLIRGEMVQFDFGAPGTGDGALFVLTVGFVAGFAERLVPDLLDKASAKPTEAAAAATAAARADGQREAEEAESAVADNAAASAPGTPAAAGAAASPETDPAVNDNDVEVGPEGFQLEDDEITDDSELPLTMGGVAKS